MIKFEFCIVIKFLSLQLTHTLSSEPIERLLRLEREVKEVSQKVLTPALTVKR